MEAARAGRHAPARLVHAAAGLPYELAGPASAGLFAYDNGTFALENFAPQPQKWRLRLPAGRSVSGLTTAAQAEHLSTDAKDGSVLYERLHRRRTRQASSGRIGA